MVFIIPNVKTPKEIKGHLKKPLKTLRKQLVYHLPPSSPLPPNRKPWKTFEKSKDSLDKNGFYHPKRRKT